MGFKKNANTTNSIALGSSIWENRVHMAVLEQLALRRARRERARLLEQYRPSEKVASVADINFAKYKAKGVNTLFLDGDGTIVSQDGWNVDPSFVDAISDAGFDNIAIVTNHLMHDELTFVKLNYWAHQIGAEIVTVPQTPKDRKPGPAMYQKALTYFGVRPDQAMMVGDKSSTDIRGGNRAGLHTVQVEPHGDNDLLGDRIVRRPIERMVERRLAATPRTEPDPHSAPDNAPVFTVYETPITEQTIPTWARNIDPELMARSRIVNVGGPIIEQKLTERTGPFADAFRKAKAEYDHYLLEHGRPVADALTKSREVGGYVEGGLILLGRKDIARIVDPFVRATDLFDGYAARKDKNGATDQGGKDDQMTDKKHALLTEVPLYLRGDLKWYDLAIRFGSDVFVNKVLRPYYEKQGVDVKAGWAGKASTTVVSIADFTAMGETNPRSVQNAANAAKVGRVGVYWADWERKARKIRREKKQLEKAKEELLAA